MAQWRTLEELEAKNETILGKIHFIYKDHDFAFDIRKSYAEFIETQNWADPSVSEGVVPLVWFERLLATLLNIGQSRDLKHKTSMKHHMETLKAMPDYERSSFFEVMRRCMKDELLLIQSFLQEPDDRRASDQDIATENVGIRQQMDESTRCVTALQKSVTFLERELTALCGNRNGETNISSTLIQNLYTHRKFAADQLEEIDGKFVDLFRDVWADIDGWKKEQKLQVTGLAKPRKGVVDILGQMCEGAGKLLTSALRLAERMQLIYSQFQDDTLVGKVNDIECHLVALLETHVTKIFVVDRPPPQIIKVGSTKSNNVFPMGVRLLGASSLDLHTTPPKVTAKFFHEKQLENALANQDTQAMCLVTNGEDKPMRLNKEGKSGSKTKSCSLVAHFDRTRLKNFQRSKDKDDLSVMDVKYFMVFYTQVTVRNKPVQLAVCSLPIVLITQVLQECNAMGTLIWNAAFPLENGRPFDEAKEGSWAKLAEVLNAIIYLNTERRLTPEQLNYLASIALDKPNDVETDFSEMMISRTRLLKEHLHKRGEKEKERTERNFSFWKWFYACMNLLQKRLKKEWSDGLIYGFVSKDVAHQLLVEQPNGTFLLRFSENYIEKSKVACGRITVAVIKENPQTGERHVFHVKDKMTNEDIFKTGLDKILDSLDGQDESLTNERLLHYLWPSKPFCDAFGPILPRRDNGDDENGYTGYMCARISIPIRWGNDTSATGEDEAETESALDMDDLNSLLEEFGNVDAMLSDDFTHNLME